MNIKELTKLFEEYSKLLDGERIKEEKELIDHYNRNLDSMRRDLKRQIEIEDKFKKELNEYESKGFFYQLFNPPPFRSHLNSDFSYFSLATPYEDILRRRKDFTPTFEGFIDWLTDRGHKRLPAKKTRY